MKDTDNQISNEEQDQPDLRRRKRMVWIATAAIVAGVLGWEYRDLVFSVAGSSGFFLLVCVAMHFFMHRGHGGQR